MPSWQRDPARQTAGSLRKPRHPARTRQQRLHLHGNSRRRQRLHRGRRSEFQFPNRQLQFLLRDQLAPGQEILAGFQDCYIWRLRIPFNEFDSPRNYLSKVQRYDRLLEATNSLSHLGEFAAACVASLVRKVPYGIYNVVNGGSVTTRQVTELIAEHRPRDKPYEFFDDEADFMQKAAKTPRSNCVLDNSKLLATGISMRPSPPRSKTP